MRLWLSEAERRPDPAPARADARKALAAGTAAWSVVAVLCWWFRAELAVQGLDWFLPMALIGVALGLAGLVVVQLRRSRMQPPRGGTTPDGQASAGA